MAELELSLHNIHPYPCKFPPSVVKKYLKKEQILLDPYCGSGTTLLEGAQKAREVYGFDCNPIAKLISDCKLLDLEKLEIDLINEITSLGKLLKLNSNTTDFQLHEFDGRDHWFSTQAQREFAILLNILGNFERMSQNWILIATTISAITNQYSNQDSETRYAAVEKDIKPNDILLAFSRKIGKNIQSLQKRGKLVAQKHYVGLGDIRNGLNLPDQHVDIVITSPPYANTMDYYLYHKQRMNLLGFDFKDIQRQEIGSRHQFSSKKDSKEIWDKDYSKAMQMIIKTLKSDGKAYFVIGDSRIAGEHIDGGELTVRSAENLGLRAKILESVSMTGKSRTFRASFQAPNKFEHVVEIQP